MLSMFVGLPIVLSAVATAVPLSDPPFQPSSDLALPNITDLVAITDLVVITGDGFCPTGFNRVQQVGRSNGDFNQGAGGPFIYFCVERQMGKRATSRVEMVASDSVDDGRPGSTFGAQRILQG